MTRVAVVMTARLASTRLPRKLLLPDTNGVPLLARTFKQIQRAQELSNGLIVDIIAACDDEELVNAINEIGGNAVMTCPSCASGTDRVAAAVADRDDIDVVVNVQGDEPEISYQDVLACAALLQKDSTAPMGTLATVITDEALMADPAAVKVVVNANGEAMYFSRAGIPFVRDAGDEDGEIRALKHLGIYVYKRDFLLSFGSLPPSRLEKLEKLEQLRVIEAGHKILVEITKNDSIGIDTQEDYEAFLKRDAKS